MLQKITSALLTPLLLIGLVFQADGQTWSKTFSEVEVGSGGSTRIMISNENEIFIDEVQVMSPNQVVRIRKIDSFDGAEIASNTLELPLTTIYYSQRGSSDLSENGVVSAYTSSSAQGNSTIFRTLNLNLELTHENITLFTDSSVTYYQARHFDQNDYLVFGGTIDAETEIRMSTLTKINSGGEVVWIKLIDGGSTPWIDYNLTGRNIEVSDDNHILISALYSDPDTFAECSFLAYDDDRLIILCDPEGNEIWRYDGDENCQYDNFPKAIFTSTNEIIVGCGDYDPDFDPPFEHPDGFYIPTVSKLNMDGEELWRVPIGEHGISASVFSVVETEEGDFVAVGTRFSLVGGQWEGFVAKITTEGEILWNHNYRYAPDRPSFIFDVALLSDGRIVCSGHAEESVGVNAAESWVMVLDQDGCLEADCGMAVNDNPESPFTIYPNPASNQLNLSWSTTTQGKALVRMTTLAGQIVLEEETTTSQQHTIDLSSIANGFYLLTVQMNNTWYVEKVVVK